VVRAKFCLQWLVDSDSLKSGDRYDANYAYVGGYRTDMMVERGLWAACAVMGI